jgi:hypothetical protein
MLLTLLMTVIILPLCVILLSVSILLKKNGKFPNTHIGGNKALGKRGINCAASQHYEQVSHQTLAERLKIIK